MDTAGILQLEARRYAAMTGNDFATLEALLHDELIYTHSSGVVDSKASYIDDAKDVFANAIKETTERSTVYLMGRVTEREANRASDIARGVSGVQKVVRVFEVITEAELADLQPKQAQKQ